MSDASPPLLGHDDAKAHGGKPAAHALIVDLKKRNQWYWRVHL